MELDSIVVIAITEFEARYLAASKAFEEGPEVWVDPTKSDCEQIDLDTARVVMATIVDGMN